MSKHNMPGKGAPVQPAKGAPVAPVKGAPAAPAKGAAEPEPEPEKTNTLDVQYSRPRKVAETLIVIPASKLYSGQVRHATDKNRVDLLAESIARDGLLETPIVRAGENGQYEIISGHHRVAACATLDTYKAGIPCRVRAFESRADADTLKVLANSLRADMTFLELADAFRTIQDRHGFPQAAIARATGYSLPHVSNALRVVAKVHPDILDDIRAGKASPSAGTLIALAGKSHDDQLAAWEPGEDDGDKKGSAKDGDKPPSKAKVADALRLLKANRKGPMDDGAILVLRWVTGEIKRWPNKLAALVEVEDGDDD